MSTHKKRRIQILSLLILLGLLLHYVIASSDTTSSDECERPACESEGKTSRRRGRVRKIPNIDEIMRNHNLPHGSDLPNMTLKDLVMSRTGRLYHEAAVYSDYLFAHHPKIREMDEKVAGNSSLEKLAEAWTQFRHDQLDGDVAYSIRMSRSIKHHFRNTLKYDQDLMKFIDGHWADHVCALKVQRKRLVRAERKRMDPIFAKAYRDTARRAMKRLYDRKKDLNYDRATSFEDLLRENGFEPDVMTPEQIEVASRALHREGGMQRNIIIMMEYLKKAKKVDDITLKVTKGRRVRALQNESRNEKYRRARAKRARGAKVPNQKKVKDDLMGSEQHTDPETNILHSTEFSQLVDRSTWWLP